MTRKSNITIRKLVVYTVQGEKGAKLDKST